MKYGYLNDMTLFLMHFPMLDEGSMPIMIPRFSGIAIDTKHSNYVAFVFDVDGIITMEEIGVAGYGLGIVFIEILLCKC